MRHLCCFIGLLIPALGFGQAQKTTTVSSASDWKTLIITAADTATITSRTKLSRAPRSKSVASAGGKSGAAPVVAKPSSAPARPTTHSFLETFADNHNGWLTGTRNGFNLEIAKDSYYIRRQTTTASRPGRSYIKLPDDLNLNKADTFTVSVEMTIPPNAQPDGGLLIGVKDTSNYCQFRLVGTSKVALYTRVNGAAQANYMVGKPTAAKVAISPTRNTLTIRRTGAELHFYINGNEVEDSPHPYRPFKGNGVGFISFAEAVKFQYLTVQLGK